MNENQRQDLPSKCSKYMTFQPGTTRATLCDLWRLPDTSEVAGNQCRFIRRNWCFNIGESLNEMIGNRLRKIQDLNAATAANAEWRTRIFMVVFGMVCRFCRGLFLAYRQRFPVGARFAGQ